MRRRRIAVIGAGGVGSATARFLANDGCDVTVFEQFVVDHDRGSSYGTSRIIRSTYPDAFYTKMMTHAWPLWHAFERDAGGGLFRRCGGLFFGATGSAEMTGVENALADNGVPHDRLTREACAVRFPQFRLAPNEYGVFEPGAGLLHASACVRAAVRLAVANGAVIRERSIVRDIAATRDGVTLSLADGAHFEADAVVVTAGAWTSRLLGTHARWPLVPSRQVYCHFAPREDGAKFAADRFPIWIDMDALYYGFPSDAAVPGVKVARHVIGRATDPDAVDRDVTDADRDGLRAYCAERLPMLSARVEFEKVCLYTNTPDADFVVDTVAGSENVHVVAGLSGHGFKFAVLLGRIAAWKAEGDVVEWDLARWSGARFARR